jgi:pentatricopeptide repeat domain-containing protein 1
MCANTKEWQLGLELFRKSEEFGMEASSVTYGITINVMTKSNQPEIAFALLEEMKQTVGPNGVALSASMMACIPTKDWQRALGYFQDLANFNIEANIVSYGSIIDVLGKAGEWGRAMEFFNEMIRLNMRPNEVIYGSMVNFMAKAGQWRLSLETFYQMDRDVGANEIALNSAIRACNRDDQWAKAIMLLKDFTAKRPNVAIKAYVATLDVLAQCNQFIRSLELFEEVLHRGYQPDIKTFNAVLSSFRALQWQMAVDFFARHHVLGIYPDALSYQVLIKSLVIAKQRDLAWQYFCQMIHTGISPTTHLCDVMARLCPHSQFRKILSQLETSPKNQQRSFLPRLESFILSY